MTTTIQRVDNSFIIRLFKNYEDEYEPIQEQILQL